MLQACNTVKDACIASGIAFQEPTRSSLGAIEAIMFLTQKGTIAFVMPHKLAPALFLCPLP